MIEDVNSKKISKEVVINSKKEAIKKKVKYKVKKDALRALLLTTILELSVPIFASVFVFRLSTVLLGSFIIMLRLFAAMIGLSAIVPGLFIAVHGFPVVVSRLSALLFASVFMIGLFAPVSLFILIFISIFVLELSVFFLLFASVPMPGSFSLFTSLCARIFRSSLLFFLALFLPRQLRSIWP